MFIESRNRDVSRYRKGLECPLGPLTQIKASRASRLQRVHERRCVRGSDVAVSALSHLRSIRVASKGKSVNSTRTKVDAVALLKADHRQVEGWFEDFLKARSDDRKVELAANICNALTVHALIEEELFYPAFLE